ncbi:MAG: hypothetical protein WBH36_05940, partial [Syntrophobacteria bacterium]
VQVRLGTNTLRLPGGTPIFVVSRQQLKLPAASCRESSKCKVLRSFYCSSLANPAAPKAGSPLRYDKLRGMRSLEHFHEISGLNKYYDHRPLSNT